jgi:predicted acetyltransferase
MTEGPRGVKKSEFKQLIKLVDTCFTGDAEAGGMLIRWPHCYLKNKLENNAIVKKNNRVVSHVASIPQELKVGSERMKIAGISGVATYPEYRGQGLMGMLLKYCIDKMENDGTSFSYLGGDRQRYGHFGWENGGREWVFDINGRSLGLKNRKIKSKIKKYRGAPADLNTIIKLYEREPFRIERSKELHRIIMRRKGWEVYLSKDDEGNSAYAVLTCGGKKRSVWEFGVKGSPEKLVDIFCYIFKKYNLEEMEIFSPYSHPLNKFFFKISSQWKIKPHYMFKIINLMQTLKGFSYQIKNKYRHYGGKIKESLTLLVKNTGQRASIHVSGNNVSIDGGLTVNRLYFSETEIVKLIFGVDLPSSSFSLGKNKYLLDCIFPLDFYIWHNDGV